jgi:tetratricopeptide (TPR) repeat protein
MRAANLSIFADTRHFVLGTGIWRAVRIFGAALLALAVKSAPCQVDSVGLPAQVPTAERMVVSKNQLRTPQKAQQAIERAQEDFLHARYDSAQRDVQRALDICPHYALAYTFQGIINLRSGNNAEAASAFQRAINEDPSAGSAYLGMGIVFNRQGRFREAIVPLDRAAPLLASSWLLHFESTWAHLGIGDSAAGLRDATSAEVLAESDPEKLAGVAYLRGVAHFQMRDYDAASRYFKEAVQHDPKGTFATLAKERAQQIGDHRTKVR